MIALGRHTIREVKAPANYGVSTETYTAVPEYSGQIVKLKVSDKSMNTGVSITKTGPKADVGGICNGIRVHAVSRWVTAASGKNPLSQAAPNRMLRTLSEMRLNLRRIFHTLRELRLFQFCLTILHFSDFPLASLPVFDYLLYYCRKSCILPLSTLSIFDAYAGNRSKKWKSFPSLSAAVSRFSRASAKSPLSLLKFT